MSASQLPAAGQVATETTRTRSNTTQARTPPPGTPTSLVLDRYRLQRRLGAGAFGTVWMGHDERLDRQVAVKIVPRERVMAARFEREARAAARLSHPAIVTLYEAAMDDDGAYLVSELVRGATLDRVLEEGRLSDHGVVVIAISLCDALAHAHEQGIVHRDVKPSNVLVPRRPSSTAYPAKLTDFGVARVIGGDSLTRTGDVVGTAAYMAPEQAEGREAGAPADLYALALMTYEALTGVNPVRTGTGAIRARRLGAHLPPLRRQRRELPRELGCAIDLALRPRPRERGTLEELRASLLASLPGLSDRPGVVTASWPRSRGGETDEVAAPDTQVALGAVPTQPINSPVGNERRSPPPPWPARALAGACAALLAGWLAAHLLAPAPLAPVAAGLIAGGLVMALPRIGWILTVATLAVTAAIQQHLGGAVVLVLASVVPIMLTPLRATAWPLGAGAPALGFMGLAGAWPAVAGRAGRTSWNRAVIAAVGWLWLLLAAPLAGVDLYLRSTPGEPASQAWTTSVAVALRDVVAPIITSGLLVGGVVWAVAAVFVPWLLRGRSLLSDTIRVLLWAAVTATATQTAVDAVSGPRSLATSTTALLGTAAAAAVMLSAPVLRALRVGSRPTGPGPELP